MYNSISYEISDNLIIAKQLFFQIKINIDDIEKITDKFTLFSTPAVWKFSMSHKTLTIKYRVNNKIKWLTISPQEENQFIQEILKIKSELEIERIKRPN
jgi:Uma2 family endonuclease